MRWIPIDTDRVQFIGTSKTAEVAEYAELSNGERKRTGQQAKDDNGVPLWVVDAMVMDPDSQRAEIAGVKVASFDEPQTTMGQPVKFHNLRAFGYIQNGSTRVSFTFRADGIDQPNHGRKAEAA